MLKARVGYLLLMTLFQRKARQSADEPKMCYRPVPKKSVNITNLFHHLKKQTKKPIYVHGV